MSNVTLVLRKNLSERFRLDKTFALGADISLTGAFREEQSILAPEFTIESSSNLSMYNYCEIPDFSRKYFMKVTAIQKNIWKLTLEVDTLSTYAAGIRSSKAFVKRTEKQDKINFYVNDGSLYTEQREIITYEVFKKNGEPAKLGNESYYMIVAGG